MKTEAILFTILMVVWPIFLFFMIKIRPKMLFKKNLNYSVIQSLRAIGINQVFNSGTEYRFKGIYKDHTISLVAKKNTAIKAYISILITYKVESSVKEHINRIEILNKELKKLPLINDFSSKWISDGLNLGWDIGFNAINYKDLKNKIDQTITLVTENKFQPLGSLNTKTQFSSDFEKEMLAYLSS